jgi:transposase
VARVDHHHGDPGGAQQPRRGPLEPAGRLDHHPWRRLLGDHLTERLPALAVLGEAPARRLRQNADFKAGLTHIDPNKTLEFVLHPLAPCHVCGLPDGQVISPRQSPAFTPLVERYEEPFSAVATKLADIVGLYVNPPQHAIVLSVDETSPTQVLDRSQPGLPIKPGKAGTMTHDYKRNGTTTLFAALNVLDGSVLARCLQRHRRQEFLRFLNTVERAVPAGKVIHAILDNYGSHKHPKILKWLARHPRWVFHFTPTAGSWLNAVETFFSTLTRRRIRRGSFHSIIDLQAAIHRYIAEHNADPKPFTWTKPAEQIMDKLTPLNASVH